jgi:stress-induced morphogen
MLRRGRVYKVLTDAKFVVPKFRMQQGIDPGAAEAGMTVEATIREKLTKAFEPSSLIVENESAKHAGHAGARDHLGHATGESHFRVVVVSEAFQGASPVERHRRINAALKDELAGPVHALAIKAMTPAEAAR